MNRHVAAFAVPFGAIICAGILIFGFSRIILAFNKEVAPFVALGIALVILMGAAMVGSKYADATEESS